MNDTPARSGLLLFAHGARDPRWAEPFEGVVRRIRTAHPGQPVRIAYLEFMSPSLGEAANELVREGCERLEVVPLFLGAGGHVRKDLPALLEAVRTAHPAVTVTLHPAVGEMPAFLDALAASAVSVLR